MIGEAEESQRSRRLKVVESTHGRSSGKDLDDSELPWDEKRPTQHEMRNDSKVFSTPLTCPGLDTLTWNVHSTNDDLSFLSSLRFSFLQPEREVPFGTRENQEGSIQRQDTREKQKGSKQLQDTQEKRGGANGDQLLSEEQEPGHSRLDLVVTADANSLLHCTKRLESLFEALSTFSSN